MYYIPSFLFTVYFLIYKNLYLNINYVLFLFLFIIIFFIFINKFFKNYYFLLFLLLGILSGLFRMNLYYYFQNHYDISHYLQNDNTQAIVYGFVLEMPDIRKSNIKLVIKTNKICFVPENQCIDIEDKVLINVGRFDKNIKYRDFVVFKGVLKSPFESEEFNYKNYLKIFDINYVMSYPVLFDIKKSQLGFRFIIYYLYEFRMFLDNYFKLIFHEPESSLVSGTLIGSRAGMPKEVERAFSITGLTHIVAVSGSNISIVILFVNTVFATRVSRRVNLLFSILFVIFFMFIVGFSSAVVRAVIMSLLVVAAKYYGKEIFIIKSLLFTAFIMVIYNPVIIIYDIGFQLSFLATLGIVLFSNNLNKVLFFITEKFAIREAVSLTVSSQLMTLPVLINNFGFVSFISILSNIVVLPFIPMIMLFGFMSLFLPFIFGPMAHIIIRNIVYFVLLISNLPFAIFYFSKMNFILIFLWYVFLYYFYLYLSRK